MKNCSKTIVAGLCGSLLMGTVLLATSPAYSADETSAAAVQSKPNWYPKRADLALVKQHAVLPKPEGVTIVDCAAGRSQVRHRPHSRLPSTFPMRSSTNWPPRCCRRTGRSW